MTKELKALERIENFLKENCHHYKQDVGYIREALQRLKAIENAKPSEALECLDKLDKLLNYVNIYKITEIEKDYNTIKQALLKAQEQEKVLEIIKEKYVDFFQFPCCRNVYEYNDLKFSKHEKITQEEFELLKAYFGKNIQK